MKRVIKFYLLSIFIIFSQTLYSQSMDSLVSQLDGMNPEQQRDVLEMLQGSGNLNDSPLGNTPDSSMTLEQLQQEQLLLQQLALEPKEELEEGEVPKFGYDLFSGRPQPLSSSTKIIVPSNYLIGVGDEIEILFLGSENRIANLIVNREGSIFVPDIGPITIAGLTFKEAKELLKTRIRNQKIGVDASISMGKLQPIQIFITGDAFNPGAYLVNSLSTLTNALFVSGGVKEIGSLRNIKLRRNGETIVNFDLYNFLMEGDNSNDVRLQSGDVIFIPPVGSRVTIKGEVVREAVYELHGEESLDKIINYAGGLLPSADRSDIQLNRYSNSNIELIDIDLTENALTDFTVNNGDEYIFRPIVKQIENYVYLEGFLRRPGFIQWKDSMTVSDVISLDEDILKETDLQYAVLVSENFPDGILTMRSFNLSSAIINKKSDKDPELKPRDTILVFSYGMPSDLDQCLFISDEINDSCLRIQKELQKENIVEKASEDKLDEAFLQEMMSAYNLDLEEAILLDQKIKDDNLSLDQDKDIDEDITIRMGNRNLILAPYIEIHRDQVSGFEDLSLVNASGAVKFPGYFPHNGLNTVHDLLKAAGGYTSSSFLGEAELISRNLNSKGEIEFKQTPINLKIDINQKITKETELFVKTINNNEEYVDVTGEVFFPGRYRISKSDSLTSLIMRAGGFTEKAYIDGAFFSREKLRILERERLEEAQEQLEQEILLASTSELGAIENVDLLLGLTQQATRVEATGRLVIDLSAILSGSIEDITLENMDALDIPSKSFDITVIGEVNRQTSHVFSEDKSKSDYIELSGGYTAFADQRGSYVISADGSVQINNSSAFFRAGGSELQPGDTIVVPANIRATNRIKSVTELSNIIYQLSVAAAAVGSFNN